MASHHCLRAPTGLPGALPSTPPVSSTPGSKLPSGPRCHTGIVFRPHGFSPSRRFAPTQVCGHVAVRCRPGFAATRPFARRRPVVDDASPRKLEPLRHGDPKITLPRSSRARQWPKPPLRPRRRHGCADSSSARGRCLPDQTGDARILADLHVAHHQPLAGASRKRGAAVGGRPARRDLPERARQLATVAVGRPEPPHLGSRLAPPVSRTEARAPGAASAITTQARRSPSRTAVSSRVPGSRPCCQVCAPLFHRLWFFQGTGDGWRTIPLRPTTHARRLAWPLPPRRT